MDAKRSESAVLAGKMTYIWDENRNIEFRPRRFRDKNNEYMQEKFRLPKGFVYQMLYVSLLPAFFIAFAFTYNPFDIQGFYMTGGKDFSFHLVMLSCIMIGSLLITRLIFMPTYKAYNFTLVHYILWCVLEIMVISLFWALYTCLFKGMPYFLAASHCYKFCALTLIYPYTFLICTRIISNKDHELAGRVEPTEETMAKFYDEHKRLKLTISADSILFIEAESNYIKINYIEGSKSKEFMLRNSMKSVAESADSYGLVRCHRSFYVNPKHIKLVSRDKEGVIEAELRQEGIKKIPVRKQFYEELADKL